MVSIEKFLDDVALQNQDGMNTNDEDDIEQLQRNLPRLDLCALKQRKRATVEDCDHLKLKKTVLLAYTDIAAGGSRALLGIDMRVEYHTLDIDHLECNQFRPACVRNKDLHPTEQHFQPLQVLNCKYEEFSLIIVNTVLSGRVCHLVVAKILDLCKTSKTERLLVLSVLNLELAYHYENAMYETALFTAPVTKYSAFPDVVIEDAFFITLLQMITVERFPTICFIIPGYKLGFGQSNDWDGSKQIIALFHETLNQITRLKFNNSFSNSLIYRGKNEQDLDMASSMYV